MMNDLECRQLGEQLARCLYVKLGASLSAPINFCCSRPYFRYMDARDMTESGKGEFALAYRRTWFLLQTHRAE